MNSGTPEAKYATCPSRSSIATTVLMSRAPAGWTGKCTCVGIGTPPVRRDDAHTITHSCTGGKKFQPDRWPMSGVLNLDLLSLLGIATGRGYATVRAGPGRQPLVGQGQERPCRLCLPPDGTPVLQGASKVGM